MTRTEIKTRILELEIEKFKLNEKPIVDPMFGDLIKYLDQRTKTITKEITRLKRLS